MADPDFFENKGPFTLETLAQLTGAEISRETAADLKINDVNSLEAAGPGDISFLSNPKYSDIFKASNATACIVSPQNAEHASADMVLLIIDDPYKAFAKISACFYPQSRSTGIIDPTAHIAKTVKLGNNVSIGAYTVIEDGVTIGDDTLIEPHSFIGKNCKIGADCRLHTHVSIRYAHIGDNVTLYAGVRIGEDGFGFAPDPAGHVKIPQLGRVMIGSNCEIGSNTTIDRGAGPDTVIGDGCWIDNLVQIAHNVQLGRGCIIAAQCGISGSTVLEDFVVLGGQVGLAGHITIGMGAQISGKSGVISDIPAGQIYAGFPARPRREFFKSIAILSRLAKGKGSRK